MVDKWLTVCDGEEHQTWSISVDGYFRSNVERRMLADDMSRDAINAVFCNAVRILSHCPNPNIHEELAETGIVIGKVQSGKTSNFIMDMTLPLF